MLHARGAIDDDERAVGESGDAARLLELSGIVALSADQKPSVARRIPRPGSLQRDDERPCESAERDADECQKQAGGNLSARAPGDLKFESRSLQFQESVRTNRINNFA